MQQLIKNIGKDKNKLEYSHNMCYVLVRCTIWYHLYNLKKREKHQWKSLTFSKVPGSILQRY